MPKVALQTTIRAENNTRAIDFLSEYAAIFGSAIRTGFSIRNTLGANTNKTNRQLESEISQQLKSRYGLSSTDARNAYSKAEATYASQVELVELYISERSESIKAVNQSIRKLEKQLALAQAQNHQEEIQKIQKKLHYKANKIQSLIAKIQKFKRQRESGIFRVTFGSSRLFDKQNRLEINGYANHEAWREDWRNARSNRIYYEGAKLFQSGNQLCKLIPNEQALIITVPPCLVNKYGQTITLHNVSFTYGKEWLENALIPTQYPDGKPRAGKQYYRTGTKQPVTYELVKRHGIWYVNAIIDQPISAITTSTENGVLGIDFNPSSLDWSIVDRHGNLKRHGSVKVNIQDKSTHQTQDILGKAIAQIVRDAALYQVPIAIEDLDFTQKKATLAERSTKSARMLSNFAYSKLTKMIETRCLRQGINLIKVDAAYTSIVGVTKYMAMYGLNSGCAAAIVIARRGQGRIEKLPKQNAIYFKKPEDCLRSNAWSRVARKINVCGGCNRHKFYFPGHKQVRTNCLLHGKLRQKLRPKRRRSTVQVLSTPHIPSKTSAVGSPDYLTTYGEVCKGFS